MELGYDSNFTSQLLLELQKELDLGKFTYDGIVPEGEGGGGKKAVYALTGVVEHLGSTVRFGDDLLDDIVVIVVVIVNSENAGSFQTVCAIKNCDSTMCLGLQADFTLPMSTFLTEKMIMTKENAFRWTTGTTLRTVARRTPRAGSSLTMRR